MSVTYCVVVPFVRTEEGDLAPLEAMEAPNADLAKRRAHAVAEKHAGAVAFSRTGDPATGEFGEPNVIAVFGAVDVGMLAA